MSPAIPDHRTLPRNFARSIQAALSDDLVLRQQSLISISLFYKGACARQNMNVYIHFSPRLILVAWHCPNGYKFYLRINDALTLGNSKEENYDFQISSLQTPSYLVRG
jgi:hypothetical protein